jgi:hypothetical protein
MSQFNINKARLLCALVCVFASTAVAGEITDKNACRLYCRALTETCARPLACGSGQMTYDIPYGRKDCETFCDPTLQFVHDGATCADKSTTDAQCISCFLPGFEAECSAAQ